MVEVETCKVALVAPIITTANPVAKRFVGR